MVKNIKRKFVSFRTYKHKHKFAKVKKPSIALKRKISYTLQQIGNSHRLIILIIGILLIYWISTNYISKIKLIPPMPQYVQGIDGNLPIYYQSYWAFSQDNNDIVSKLLKEHISAYAIDYNINYDDLVNYYSAINENNWEFVNYVPTNDTSHYSGIYLINNDIKIGVHIWLVSNDIWYEQISYKDAQNMLQSYKELQTKLYLSATALQGDELPSDYPFKLHYSFEYEVINIPAHDFPTNGFALISKTEKISIIPFRWFTNIPLEDAINEYLKENLDNNPQCKNQTEIKIGKQNGYKCTLQPGKNTYYIATFKHPNNIIYIISGLECSKTLFDYVLDNLQIKD